MALVIRRLQRASKPELLNEEWILVQNTGTGVLNASGWTIAVARAKGQRPVSLGTLSPGFMLQPGEKMRLVTGTGSKKSQGAPPVGEDAKNYHLFLREPLLAKGGQQVLILLKQMELARAEFDPAKADGIAPAPAG